MKRTTFDKTGDQIAADRSGPDPKLMCTANGCPNRWSTSDGQLCRWHAAETDPHKWPWITQELNDMIVDRIVERERPKSDAHPMLDAEKVANLNRLRTVLTEKKDPHAWLYALRARAAAGEKMSAAQKHALNECKSIGDKS